MQLKIPVLLTGILPQKEKNEKASTTFAHGNRLCGV